MSKVLMDYELMRDKRQIYLLQSAATFWQFGDWQSLVSITVEEIKENSNEVPILLYLLDGHLQLGNLIDANEILDRLRFLDVNSKEIYYSLLSSLFNTLGRANILADNFCEGFNWFEMAISYGMPGAQVETLSQGRASEQLKQLGYKKTFFYEPLNENNTEVTLKKDEIFQLGVLEEAVISNPGDAKIRYEEMFFPKRKLCLGC